MKKEKGDLHTCCARRGGFPVLDYSSAANSTVIYCVWTNECRVGLGY